MSYSVDFPLKYNSGIKQERNTAKKKLRQGKTNASKVCFALRSGDSGSNLNTVNSLSCSRNSLRWLELSDMVRYPKGSSHQKMVHCDQGSATWCLNDAQLVLRGLKCTKKIHPDIITLLLIQGRNCVNCSLGFLFLTDRSGLLVLKCSSA